MLEKAARFQLFLKRLEAAPAASTHDQAFTLIANTLTAVEDQHSGVIGNPLHWESDGRMYPPQQDAAKSSTEFEGVVVYRNRRHRTLIGSNGAIQIVEVGSADILLQKTGMGIPFFRPDRWIRNFPVEIPFHSRNIHSMELLPDHVRTFLSLLKDKGVVAEPRIEKGGDRSGEWWLDFDGLTVEWRPSLGFGFSLGADPVYGEGPSEIFRTPARAAIRAKQLLIPGSRRTPASLRTVRELYEMTQGQVASKLAVQQAAISRLEARTDSKMDTLSAYIQSLGGQLEVRAIFADGQLPIFRSHPMEPHASLESHRATVA